MLAGREQLPPLSASVIVAMFAAPEPVAEQLVKPLPRVIVGLAVTV